MNSLLLDEFLRQTLVEDIGSGDITSEAIFSKGHCSRGCLVAKQDFVLAGIQVFTRAFKLLNDLIQVKVRYQDGDWIQKGEEFAILEGETLSLLAGERVALNLLQRMSGIATQTRRYVQALQGSGVEIVDTRKTTPGLRMLDKYAVTVGGGKNHRFGLDSLVLIKDNHIQAAGGIAEAVRKVRQYVSPYVKIEVEAESLAQVQAALAAQVDVIMLDNMTLTMICEAVQEIKDQALIEVSGNVTLERLTDLAATGVNMISSGALTHSVKAVDISMKLK